MADFETYNFFEAQQDSDAEKTGVQPVARQADLSIDDWNGFGARFVSYLRQLRRKDRDDR